MNSLLKFAEKRFAVFSLLVFTGVLNCGSYYNASQGSTGSEEYVSSPLDRPLLIIQYGIYAASIILMILRFKSVVRPAMRDPFLWALMVIIVTSFIWSDFPDISQKLGFRTLYTTFYGLYLASRFSMKQQVRIVAWALGIAAVFSFLYTLALPGAGIERGMNAGAWRGPVLQKNPFARLMIVSALPVLLVALNSRRYRYLVWTVFGIAFILVILSTSKTALVILLNLLILLPLYWGLRKSDNLAIPFLITFVLIGGSAVTWLVSDWDNVLAGLGKDPTLSGRTDIWDTVIEQIGKRPWLGYGYAAFWQEGGAGEYVWHVIRYKVFQAHNGFLNLGAELGLLGLSFFVLSIISAYIRAVKWLLVGTTTEDLWPVIYITFLPLYNYSETTTVEPNSIFWILFVAITLSLRRLPVGPFEEEIQAWKPGSLETKT